MNALDLVILAVVGLAALLGLQSGILRPVSGTGGLILGVLLAIQHRSRVAVMLIEQIEGDLLREVVAFIAIVLAVIVVTRAAAILFKRLLGVLAIGWMDHAAGALGGAAVGTVLAGTAVFLLTGADIVQTRESIRSSVLAPEVTRASLIASPAPWCSTLAESGAEVGQGCTDLKGLAKQLIGRYVPKKATEFLENDGGGLVEVIKGSLTGSSADLQLPGGATEKGAELLKNDEVSLVEVLKGTLAGSPADLKRLGGGTE
jgi:uncharacterized membrane protein required for colicin V production